MPKKDREDIIKMARRGNVEFPRDYISDIERMFIYDKDLLNQVTSITNAYGSKEILLSKIKEYLTPDVQDWRAKLYIMEYIFNNIDVNNWEYEVINKGTSSETFDISMSRKDEREIERLANKRGLDIDDIIIELDDFLYINRDLISESFIDEYELEMIELLESIAFDATRAMLTSPFKFRKVKKFGKELSKAKTERAGAKIKLDKALDDPEISKDQRDNIKDNFKNKLQGLSDRVKAIGAQLDNAATTDSLKRIATVMKLKSDKEEAVMLLQIASEREAELIRDKVSAIEAAMIKKAEEAKEKEKARKAKEKEEQEKKQAAEKAEKAGDSGNEKVDGTTDNQTTDVDTTETKPEIKADKVDGKTIPKAKDNHTADDDNKTDKVDSEED